MRINLPARAASAEQRRTRTRERLLDAAESVVAEKGFESASIEEFVTAAGVARGTFYNYFPTVTELLHALNTRVAEDIDRRLDAIVGDIEDPVARLAATLHTVVANCLADPVRGWVAVQIATSGVPRQHAFEDRFAAIYREGVACGGFRDVGMAAAYIIAFGAVRMAQRDMLRGAALPAHGVQVVALILSAFGVPFEAAEQISREEAAAARLV
ncbi:MAG TPA: TetR/AcrR family transcriptional regulator [Phenylobacterium sp.]|jgi:AcrR family transcriptional regulator|nr:TetR/AcrR family transcriptional regulator [Phenylobacterium sp.]